MQIKSTSLMCPKPSHCDKPKKNEEVLSQYLQTIQGIDKLVKIQPKVTFDVSFSSYLLR